MNVKVLASALVAITMLAGCDDAPSCETAIRRAVKRLESRPPGDEAIGELVKVCIDEKWSGKKRSCIASASSREAASRCVETDGERGGGRAGRRTEAELNLNAINKVADSEFSQNAQYPVATVALTPATPCCEQPGKKCQVVASDWNGVPAWDALAFEMTQPFYYQYSYTSDGKTFEATAVGDLDCDGVTVTYTLRGSAPDGSPTSTLTKPARAD